MAAQLVTLRGSGQNHLSGAGRACDQGFFRLPGEAGLRDCTAEALRAQSKDCLIKNKSKLYELCAAAVNALVTVNPE
jgi:hypothetical protein